ncbi:MAG: TRAP transporter large permease [Proteobacteria bacterium]|nr:TRAP transporter large permease [Pseudomonadota bacterium]
MSPITVGFIGIAILLVLLFSRMQIGVAMGLVGFCGFAYIIGFDAALGLLKTVPYATFSQQSLSVIPLFILMGSFCFSAGISEDLYRGIHKWLGHLRGGLATATVVACACFAAISGSSLATVATMGKVAMPEMRRYNYSAALATGSIAAGGSMGILIPPSVILIIYGIITEQSIGKLFLAGFIPGLLEGIFYIITIRVITGRDPKAGPRGPEAPFREKIMALRSTWEVAILFLVVIGGIYLGWFTPTEAAGVGAFGAFLLTIIRKKLNRNSFVKSLVDTSMTSGMLFAIILGAMVLGYFLSVTRLPHELATVVSTLPVNRYVILILILITTLVLGCVMDSMAIVLLTIPVFYPLILELGFDPIWFGILVVRVTEMGLITPPVGLNVYVIKGISGTPMKTVFKGIYPFLIADLCEVILLIAFPQITLFLPNLMDI